MTASTRHSKTNPLVSQSFDTVGNFNSRDNPDSNSLVDKDRLSMFIAVMQKFMFEQMSDQFDKLSNPNNTIEEKLDIFNWLVRYGPFLDQEAVYTFWRNLGRAFNPASVQFKEAVHNSPVSIKLLQKLDLWLQGVATKEGILALGAPHYIFGTLNSYESYFSTGEKKARFLLNLLAIVLENKVCQEMAVEKGINETLSSICANEDIDREGLILSPVFTATVKCLSIMM